MTRHHLPIALLSAAAVAALALPAVGAGAGDRTRDRDHDRMPDRWERAHGLKVARDDARRDRDQDGLRNLAEYRAKLDPRDADTDDDGVRDGAEDAGTIVSFTGGVLVIKTFGGESLTGRVTGRTEIECDGGPPARPRSAGEDAGDDHRGRGRGRGADDERAGDDQRNGDDDGSPGGDQRDGDDERTDGGDRRHDGDEHAGTGTTGATGPTGATGATGTGGSVNRRDDDGRPEDAADDDCGTAALVAGARVDEAKLAVTRAGRVWREVELAS